MNIISTIATALLMFAMLMVGSTDAFGQVTQEVEASDEEHTNPRIVVDSEAETPVDDDADSEAPADDDVDSEAPDDAD